MSSPLHPYQTATDGIHIPFAWKFSSSTTRNNFTPSEGYPNFSVMLTSADLYKLALQTDDNSSWMLISISPVTWVAFGAPPQAFTVGVNQAKTTGSISITSDNLYAEQIDQQAYLYVSGAIGLTGSIAKKSIFGGDVYVSGSLTSKLGFSGSLTNLVNGLSYLIAGANMIVTSQSNGQIVIASTATGGGGADVSASYVTIGNTGSLPNERALAVGTGLTLSDGGSGANVTIGVNNAIVATVSGTNFIGLTSIDPSQTQVVGTDVTFYVSGSARKNDGNRKVAVFGGDIIASGSIINAITSTIVASNYTIQLTDMYIHMSQSLNNVTCSLPSPAFYSQFVLKDIVGSGSSFPFLLKRNGSERIDTVAADKTLQSNFGSWLVWSDGTNWWSAGGI